jgi:hypothetical protein
MDGMDPMAAATTKVEPEAGPWLIKGVKNREDGF